MLLSNASANSTNLLKSFAPRETLSVILFKAIMDKRTQKRKTGDIGESIASKFLVKRGFSIIARNYLKKCGEIDIICNKDGKLFFVEVKTSRGNVSHETSDVFRPEDNIHQAKINRIDRAIQVYLEETNYLPFSIIFGVIIELDEKTKEAKVRLLNDFAW